MFCVHCGKEIPDDTRFCIYCGGDQSEVKNKTVSNSVPIPNTAKTNINTSKNIPLLILAGVLGISILIGGIIFLLIVVRGKLQGKYTALKLYQELEDNEVIPYSLTDQTKSFLKKHNELFPANEGIDSSFVDYTADSRQILKNPGKFGDKLVYLPSVSVVQVGETEIADNEYLTEVNVMDGNYQSYYVIYRGELPDVYENTEVTIYGLPLGVANYENIGGGATITIVLAGAEVDILEDSGSYVTESNIWEDDFNKNTYAETDGQEWLAESTEADEELGDDEEAVEYRFYNFVENCNQYYFSRENLEGFTAYMAMMARNAPYAHEGRIFDNREIAGFYENFEWYYPLYEPNEFQESYLNRHEVANRNLLIAYEKEMGYR